LWCESVAPFGNPVVPLVYWMLIASVKSSSADRARSASALTCVAPARSSSHSGVSKKIDRSSAGRPGLTSATIAV